MGEIVTLADANWHETIGGQATLIIFSKGEGLRGDFVSAFRKAAESNQTVLFAEVNPIEQTALAQTFNVGEKPLMVGYLNGETLVRKTRPWGSDVTLAIELLEQKKSEQDAAATADSTSDNISISDNGADAAAPHETLDTAEKTPKGDTAMSDIPNNAPIAVDDQTFQELVIDHSNEMPVIVDFWAEWCGPCRMVAPIMETLAQDYAGRVRVAKVDTDANPGLSQAFRIMSIPTNMIFKGGHLVFSQPGAFPEAAYRDLLDQVIDLDVEAAIAEAKAKEEAGE